MGQVFNNENIISNINLFPSVNVIYNLKENKNLRLAYSPPLPDPVLRRHAEIFDPLSNLFFIGNIDIRPTYIDNFDIRYEAFSENAQLFAISAFYKTNRPHEIALLRPFFKLQTIEFRNGKCFWIRNRIEKRSECFIFNVRKLENKLQWLLHYI